QFALRPPTWRRAAAVDLLDPAAGPLVAAARDAASRSRYRDAHAFLAEHFQGRTSRWPLRASARVALSAAIGSRFPDVGRQPCAEGDRIQDGLQDLLGYHDIAVGNPPDWHQDPIHRRRAPMEYWASIPYLDPALGDHKIIWEMNRHPCWLTL